MSTLEELSEWSETTVELYEEVCALRKERSELGEEHNQLLEMLAVSLS